MSYAGFADVLVLLTSVVELSALRHIVLKIVVRMFVRSYVSDDFFIYSLTC